MIGNENDETNFPHKLLLANKQVTSLCTAFATNLSINVKLSKTQLFNIVQSGRLVGEPRGLLLKTV